MCTSCQAASAGEIWGAVIFVAIVVALFLGAWWWWVHRGRALVRRRLARKNQVADAVATVSGDKGARVSSSPPPGSMGSVEGQSEALAPSLPVQPCGSSPRPGGPKTRVLAPPPGAGTSEGAIAGTGHGAGPTPKAPFVLHSPTAPRQPPSRSDLFRAGLARSIGSLRGLSIDPRRYNATADEADAQRNYFDKLKLGVSFVQVGVALAAAVAGPACCAVPDTYSRW